MQTTVALVGFGVVGQGFARLLAEKQAFIRSTYDRSIDVVAIAGSSKGSIVDPRGIDLPSVLRLVESGQSLEHLNAPLRGLDSLELIGRSDADVVVEVTPTDTVTGRPAIDHIEEALRRRSHVVTANKGPIALDYHRLAHLAMEHGVSLRFEGTVLSGTPVFSLIEQTLAGLRIDLLRGILNGTTNFMLCQMERGLSYQDALIEAQKRGYAETDPSGDVEGHDAVAKVVILANTLLGASLKPSDVARSGMTGLSLAEVQEARRRDCRLKLIGHVSRLADGGCSAHVGLEAVPAASFLGSIDGAYNALTLRTDALGELSITGPGAGSRETGYAILSDVLAIARSRR